MRTSVNMYKNITNLCWGRKREVQNCATSEPDGTTRLKLNQEILQENVRSAVNELKLRSVAHACLIVW